MSAFVVPQRQRPRPHGRGDLLAPEVGTVLLGQLEPAQAREIAAYLFEAAARAEYDHREGRSVKPFEVVLWLVLGGLAGSIGDNAVGWAVFGALVVWSGAGSLPAWAGHPRMVGFCRGVACSIVVVLVCVAVGVLSLGGRP